MPSVIGKPMIIRPDHVLSNRSSEIDRALRISEAMVHAPSSYFDLIALRTGVETGKVDEVLDGDLEQFIEPYLLGVRRSDRAVDDA